MGGRGWGEGGGKSCIITTLLLFSVSTANFFPVSMHNSSTLPLTFVFELTEAIPVCSHVRDELLKICGTGILYNMWKKKS